MPTCRNCQADYVGPQETCESCGQPLDSPPSAQDAGKPTPRSLVDQVLVSLVRFWPAIAAAVLIGVIHQAMLHDSQTEWWKTDGYYSHGVIVPFIAAYIVWANRKRLAQLPVKPSWLGLLLILPAAPVYMFGRWTGNLGLHIFTFLAMLVGSALLTAGTRITRVLLFPLLYLFFMIPLPGTVLDEFTLRIQLQSTTVAAGMLELSGYPSTQRGSEITSPDLPEPLRVGVECSGFKLFISLITFTTFFVYMVDTGGVRFRDLASKRLQGWLLRLLGWAIGFIYCGIIGYHLAGKSVGLLMGVVGLLIVEFLDWKKWFLLFISFPLSILINALRITMIGYAGIWTHSTDAMHTFHDYSGYLGLIICFVILFGVARLIRASAFWVTTGEAADAPAADPRRHAAGAARFAPAVILVLLVLLNWAISPLEATSKGRLVAEDIPKEFGGWVGTDIPIEKRVADELKTGVCLQRVYQNLDDGRRVELFITAAKDSDAFHNPLSCITGGGSVISGARPVTIRVKKPVAMTLNATILEVGNGGGDTGIILHWYMTGRETFPSTSSMKRNMRWNLLRDIWHSLIYFRHRDEIRRQMQRRQYVWYRFSTEVVDDVDAEEKALKDFAVQFIANRKHFVE